MFMNSSAAFEVKTPSIPIKVLKTKSFQKWSHYLAVLQNARRIVEIALNRNLCAKHQHLDYPLNIRYKSIKMLNLQ